MEVKGFQGQRITADHAVYYTARAVWNGAIDQEYITPYTPEQNGLSRGSSAA